MEVTVYTRHTEGCPHIKDRYYKRCSCRKSFDYSRNGKQIRESAKTRSWDTAVKLARKMEREDDDRRLGIVPTPKVGAITIEGAVLAYLKKIGDPKEGRQAPTLVKPKRMTNLLIEFCDRKNLTYLSELTPLLLEEWRTSWTYDPKGQSLRIHDHVARAFFRWCTAMDLLEKNPYERLNKYKAKSTPQTMPLSQEEVTNLLGAIPLTNLSAEAKSYTHALMRLQRWSGLSIVDAVTLKREALSDDDSIELRRTKTGEPVITALPHDVADELRMHERTAGYFFWKNELKRSSATKIACKWYQEVFDQAKVSRSRENGGLPLSHRFRDTFAVEFLLSGGSFDDLARLLGHTTTATTHKHYDAWTPARKERLVKVAKDSIAKQRAAKDGEATIQ
jgi:integrase